MAEDITLYNFMFVVETQKFFDQQEVKKKMSLQSVNDLSNQIETIVDADKNLWLKQAHVRKFFRSQAYCYVSGGSE